MGVGDPLARDVDNFVRLGLDSIYARVDTTYIKNTAANGANEMTYKIRLNVRGCTTEQYAAVALRLARGDGIEATHVVRVTRTAKGAVVTVAA